MLAVTRHQPGNGRFEDGRRLLDLIGESGQMLQLVHRRLRVLHTLGSRCDLMAQVVWILTADTHLDERLNLRLDAIELDRHELRVLCGLPIVLQSQLRVGDTVLQGVRDALVTRSLRRLEARPQFGELGREVFLARAAKKSIEPVLRYEQAEEEIEQPVQGRSANLLGRIGAGVRLAADARRDRAHLEAALPQQEESSEGRCRQ